MPKINRTRDRISRILVNVINASNRSIKDKDLTINIERKKSISMLNLKIHSAESIVLGCQINKLKLIEAYYLVIKIEMVKSLF